MKNSVLENFRKKILAELQRKKIGYTAFADLCGVNRKIMGDIVNDRKNDIKLSTMVRICENSDIDMREVLGSEVFGEKLERSSAYICIDGISFRVTFTRM